MILEKAAERGSQRIVFKNQGGDLGARENRIDERDHAEASVEQGEFERELAVDANLRSILHQRAKILLVHRIHVAAFKYETALDFPFERLPDARFAHRVDGIGPARELQIFLRAARQQPPVLSGNLARFVDDAQIIQGAAVLVAVDEHRVQILMQHFGKVAPVVELAFKNFAAPRQIAFQRQLGFNR